MPHFVLHCSVSPCFLLVSLYFFTCSSVPLFLPCILLLYLFQCATIPPLYPYFFTCSVCLYSSPVSLLLYLFQCASIPPLYPYFFTCSSVSLLPPCIPTSLPVPVCLYITPCIPTSLLVPVCLSPPVYSYLYSSGITSLLHTICHPLVLNSPQLKFNPLGRREQCIYYIYVRVYIYTVEGGMEAHITLENVNEIKQYRHLTREYRSVNYIVQSNLNILNFITFPSTRTQNWLFSSVFWNSLLQCTVFPGSGQLS